MAWIASPKSRLDGAAEPRRRWLCGKYAALGALAGPRRRFGAVFGPAGGGQELFKVFTEQVKRGWTPWSTCRTLLGVAFAL